MQVKRFINTDVGLARFDDRKKRYTTCRGKNSYLHRRVYEKSYGKIPYGFEIHHKDGNRFNNHIDNLKALSPDVHKKVHQNMERKRYNIEVIENTKDEARADPVITLTYGDDIADFCEAEEVVYNMLDYF